MIRALLVAVLTFATPVSADAFERVTEKNVFLTLVLGKALTNRLYGVTLTVSPYGQISGDAFGRAVVGDWSWQRGFFCREMTWGDRAIPYNCQLVEARGTDVRFTSDQGAGDAASFKLR